jgi:CheY-like chemotaxis protein
MERVLIVDPDAMHAAELQGTLEGVGYQATVCSDEKTVCETIKENCPDLVVVVPRSPVALSDTLAFARSAMMHLERQPELLFLLRWTCRGPAERLLADRWNAQVLYER